MATTPLNAGLRSGVGSGEPEPLQVPTRIFGGLPLQPCGCPPGPSGQHRRGRRALLLASMTRQERSRHGCHCNDPPDSVGPMKQGKSVMPQLSMSRLAGPLGIVAGTLMVGAQLVMLPFDPKDHVATTTARAFQLGGVFYLLGFVALLLFVITSHAWHERSSGRLGVVATLAAVVGTMALGGDLWFETFAVPWLADEAPNAFSTEPTVLLALGAIGSYLLFALGWVLYGVAGLRAGVFPRAISAAIVVAGVLGFRALLSPWAVPLGLTVGVLGVWMVRSASVVDEETPIKADVRTAVGQVV
jgi:hypothetical protein